MHTYLLRGLDPALWAAVKARATKDGHAIRWVIVKLLERYVHHGL